MVLSTALFKQAICVKREKIRSRLVDKLQWDGAHIILAVIVLIVIVIVVIVIVVIVIPIAVTVILVIVIVVVIVFPWPILS